MTPLLDVPPIVITEQSRRPLGEAVRVVATEWDRIKRLNLNVFELELPLLV